MQPDAEDERNNYLIFSLIGLYTKMEYKRTKGHSRLLKVMNSQENIKYINIYTQTVGVLNT